MPGKGNRPPKGPANQTVGTPSDNPYRNSPTLAELLAQSKQARGYRGARLVERFRRLGAERWGLWWEFMLDCPPDELDPPDYMFVNATWDQFVNGETPFKRRRVCS